MTYKEAEAERSRKDLAEFLRDKVISDKFDLDDLDSLRAFVKNESKNTDAEAAFCDWLELGDWFREAIIACDLDVHEFLDELELDLQSLYEEAVRDRAERDDDYLRMVVAR